LPKAGLAHFVCSYIYLQSSRTKRNVPSKTLHSEDRLEPSAMASNGVPGDFSVANVLAAMSTMKATDSGKKQAAMDYLGKFQKSVRSALSRRPQSHAAMGC
jgi:hypothetical protein